MRRAEPRAALRPLSACGDGTYVAYAGFESGTGQGLPRADWLCELSRRRAKTCRAIMPYDSGASIRNGWIDDWEGISVSLFGRRITRIDLDGSEEQPGNLTGFIPPQLAQLTELQISGPFPIQSVHRSRFPLELGSLSDLTYLELGGNRLTGAIPPELAKLANLTGLFLYRNDLTGTVPPDLGVLTDLETLSLGGNRLSGEIPPLLGNLKRLLRLWLWGNELSGPIPPELGGLSRLENLQLQNNNLTGTIPRELSRLSQLTGLWLNGNELSGSIPPDLGQLAQLEKLSLYGNLLTGPIPPELGQLTRLTGLWLGRKQPRRFDPQGTWTAGSDWKSLSLGGNRLNGSIPRGTRAIDSANRTLAIRE